MPETNATLAEARLRYQRGGWRVQLDAANVAASMMALGWRRWFALFALALLGCGAPKTGASSPAQGGLRVETSDPPPGARLVGPVEGSDGPDCGVLDARGTEAGARAALRLAAAQRGIDFVKVTQITEPYSDHTCVHKRYRIQGVGYAIAPPPAPAPAPAPICTPDCAPGYVCHAGTCEAQCEPTCGPGQFCRFDRVCAPMTH